jgi:hypothetical protein
MANSTKDILLRLELKMNQQFIELSGKIGKVYGKVKQVFNLVQLQGEQLKAQGEQLKAQGEQLKAQGEQLKAQGEQITYLVSLVEDLKSDNLKLTAIVQNNNELLKQLCSEVARFTAEDSRVMLSIFAYADSRQLEYSREIGIHNSRRMRQLCEDKGWHYERIADPRYGQVYVYPQDKLDNAFVDINHLDYIGWERVYKRADYRYEM